MSKKSRERRMKNKINIPDDYYNNGVFEIARFGKNTIMKNQQTVEQQNAMMEYLKNTYSIKYNDILKKIILLKEQIVRCEPYGLLLYLSKMALISQMNVFSEIENSKEAIAIIHAQEYIQSVLITSENLYREFNDSDEEQEQLYNQVLADFEKIYEELLFFLPYWAAKIKEENDFDDTYLENIVEAQYMYGVRGNRYQFFELEPIKVFLPSHNDVLLELFGVSAEQVILGLEKLRYSLSQGYADEMMRFASSMDAIFEKIENEKTTNLNLDEAQDSIQKLFGTDLNNVKLITDWDDRFIDMLSSEVNEIPSFWNDKEFSGWPFIDLPVVKKPFIKINGTSYAFLYYTLFDNIYRNIQKSIMQQKPQYLETWKEKQTYDSEHMVANLFGKILPGAEIYIGNYYPVNNSLKQMNENDIILIYNKYLFIIEVKAGSFPTTPPITDFNAHIAAYKKLAGEADSQCSRTLQYISSHPNAQFYNKEKNPVFQIPTVEYFDEIFTFSVTVDNFNEFAAKVEKLSVITLKEKTIVISIDDLLVYANYFDSPIMFLHFLKQRKSAMDVKQYYMNDELDHLGLYIDRNCYALNPSQYGDVKTVFWNGFRQDLDMYFSMLYCNPVMANKPVQNIPIEILDIIHFIEKEITSEGISFANFLLDLCGDTKKYLASQIKYALKRQRELMCTIPMIGFGDVKYCCFVSIPGIDNYTVKDCLDYTFAATSRNEDIPVMCILLEYDNSNSLVSAQGKLCSFFDVPSEDIERITELGCSKAKDWVLLHKKGHGKIGRNEYCPCGSGKKYKNCCIY